MIKLKGLINHKHREIHKYIHPHIAVSLARVYYSINTSGATQSYECPFHTSQIPYNILVLHNLCPVIELI